MRSAGPGPALGPPRSRQAAWPTTSQSGLCERAGQDARACAWPAPDTLARRLRDNHIRSTSGGTLTWAARTLLLSGGSGRTRQRHAPRSEVGTHPPSSGQGLRCSPETPRPSPEREGARRILTCPCRA